MVRVVRSAPRYDPRILEAMRALDDRTEPMAETCRRIGTVAEHLGLVRPSYVHLRRLVVAEREWARAEAHRRAAIRAIAGDAAEDLMLGRRRVDAYQVADRIRKAGAGS